VVWLDKRMINVKYSFSFMHVCDDITAVWNNLPSEVVRKIVEFNMYNLIQNLET